MTEEEISLLLDTYMYLNYKDAPNGMSLGEVLEEISGQEDYQAGGEYYEEYEILSKAAAAEPLIGEMVIGNQSHLMGCDPGTAACTFSDPEKERFFVVYRGTGDGEWPDNGKGMTEASTLQQERALDYFDQVVEQEALRPEQTLILTGHSKGGNKAQYVNMSTEHEELIDVCYSVDGQGFSQKAVSAWRELYGEEGFSERAGKIIGIHGENDYVSALGISIIPKEQIRYIKTPVEKSNFAGYHDIKYLFADWEYDPVSGKRKNVFHGRKNPYVLERGELGGYAAALSAGMMELEEGKLEGCAATVMQLMELGGERKTGLNGERVSLLDLNDFYQYGIPVMKESLFTTEEGIGFLGYCLGREESCEEMKGRLYLAADFHKMKSAEAELLKLAGKLQDCRRETEGVLQKVPELMQYSFFLRHKLKKEIGNMEEEILSLKELSEKLSICIGLYQAQDGAQ